LSASHISNIYPWAYSRTALAAQKNASRTDTFVLMVCITYYYYYYYNLETWKIEKRGKMPRLGVKPKNRFSIQWYYKEKKMGFRSEFALLYSKNPCHSQNPLELCTFKLYKTVSKHSSNIKLFHVQIVALNQIYGLHR
jgi:hypothetical protein